MASRVERRDTEEKDAFAENAECPFSGLEQE
jgi:hypothetical protein